MTDQPGRASTMDILKELNEREEKWRATDIYRFLWYAGLQNHGRLALRLRKLFHDGVLNGCVEQLINIADGRIGIKEIGDRSRLDLALGLIRWYQTH